MSRGTKKRGVFGTLLRFYSSSVDRWTMAHLDTD